MQGRRETTHKAPRFFSRLPRTPSTLFPLPLTVQGKRQNAAAFGKRFAHHLHVTIGAHDCARCYATRFLEGGLRGKGRGVGRVREAEPRTAPGRTGRLRRGGIHASGGKLFACSELVEGGLIWLPLATPALNLFSSLSERLRTVLLIQRQNVTMAVTVGLFFKPATKM